MLEYTQTTGFILLWLFVISVLFAVLVFYCQVYRSSLAYLITKTTSHQPALALAALIIFAAYQMFKINLVFPVHMITEWYVIFFSASSPAVVLFLASGLGRNIARQIELEYLRWSAKQFYQTRRSLGLSAVAGVRRLVVLRSLLVSWNISLPWIFSEIIIVESIFNAPGLGLAIWRQAKMRDLEGLISTSLTILFLYLFCYTLSLISNKWLGRKLEGYN
jgi:ABC-type dipeptide/oligopeptide/nickel transport system permease component